MQMWVCIFNLMLWWWPQILLVISQFRACVVFCSFLGSTRKKLSIGGSGRHGADIFKLWEVESHFTVNTVKHFPTFANFFANPSLTMQMKLWSQSAKKTRGAENIVIIVCDCVSEEMHPFFDSNTKHTASVTENQWWMFPLQLWLSTCGRQNCCFCPSHLSEWLLLNCLHCHCTMRCIQFCSNKFICSSISSLTNDSFSQQNWPQKRTFQGQRSLRSHFDTALCLRQSDDASVLLGGHAQKGISAIQTVRRVAENVSVKQHTATTRDTGKQKCSTNIDKRCIFTVKLPNNKGQNTATMP